MSDSIPYNSFAVVRTHAMLVDGQHEDDRIRHAGIEYVKKNTNAVTDATSEQEQDCLNPYQPSAIANPIKRLSTRQLIGFSIISPLIACVYGLYSSWSPILFVGVILLGTPLTLIALMLNRREIHQASTTTSSGTADPTNKKRTK